MKLSTKVLSCVALASILAGEGIIVCSRKAVYGALLSNLELAGKKEVLASMGALSAATGSADERLILPVLQSVLKASGASYAAVLDQSGRVLGHSNVVEVGRVYRDPFTTAALKADAPISRQAEVKGRFLLELAVPIRVEPKAAAEDDFLFAEAGDSPKGERLGILRLALPLAEALATEREISAQIFRIVLFWGGAMGLALLALMRRVLAPIGLLADATETIRRGELHTAIPVTSNDEIGELTQSFNAMSLELSRTTVSKDYLVNILDSIQDHVIVTDAAGTITLVNPAVCRSLGYAKEELIGRPAAALLEAGDFSFTAPEHNRSVFFLRKNKERLAMLLSAAPLMSEHGAVAGYIAAAKDVSDLKKMEARMHQSEKLSAVGQLAAGVAHEINNPLGVILGFSQGMARQLKAGDALELPIMSIEREALRCKALVQNLLTFARASRSDRAPLDLNGAVTQALALIEPQAKIGRVQVSVNLAAGLPPILGNKNQVEQVIMNLAKNAIDAMPGGGTLALSSELLEQSPRSWVCLRIVDSGSGIAEDLVGKIFEPFFTTKPIGQGTGLGLSLVSEIVQKHSGEISVDSRPGLTAFSVKFPARTGGEAHG